MITQKQYKAIAAIFTLAMALLLAYEATADGEMKVMNIIFESVAVIAGIFFLIRGKARTGAA